MTTVTFNVLKFINENVVTLVALVVILYIIVSASLYSIYDKIGMKKINALIPIYNLIYLLKILELPIYLVLLLIIPYVNYLGIFVFCFLVNFRLGFVLNKSSLIRVGMVFLPYVFVPMASYGKVYFVKYSELVAPKVEPERDISLDLPKYDIDDVMVNDAIGIADFDVHKQYNTEKYLTNVHHESEKEKNDEDLFAQAVMPADIEKKEKKRAQKKDENKKSVSSKNAKNAELGDGFTFDYNKLYNVTEKETDDVPDTDITAVQPEPEIVEPVQPEDKPSEEKVEWVEVPAETSKEPANDEKEDKPKKESKEEKVIPSVVNPMDNFVTPIYEPTIMSDNYSLSQGIPEIVPNPKIDPKAALNTLQMAAPPSFEVKEEPRKIKQEERPIIREVPKEDLVSIKIVEPSSLPVGSLKKPMVSFNGVNSPDATLQAIQNNPLLTPMNQSNNKPVINDSNSLNQINPFATGPSNNNLPTNEPKQVSNNYNQKSPTATDLAANPMAIFGKDNLGLRPTNEDLAAAHPQVQEQQKRTIVCPKCGFVVKEGQPTCVVCGNRFNW